MMIDSTLTDHWTQQLDHESPMGVPPPNYIDTAQSSQTNQTNKVWRLPRTAIAETLANRCKARIERALTQQMFSAESYSAKAILSGEERALFGILLVETSDREKCVLKAFSGCSNLCPSLNGWVPTLSLQSLMDLLEIQTLRQLDYLKADLVSLTHAAKHSPTRKTYECLAQGYEGQLQQLNLRHRQKKEQRDRLRTHYHRTLSSDALHRALAELDQQSRQDSGDRRRLKQQRDQALAPWQLKMDQAAQQIQALKQEYQGRSHQWQALMQNAYAARWQQEVGYPLDDGAIKEHNPEESCFKELLTVFPTGFRAATKLLHYATTHQLKPLAIAEFWLSLSDDIADGTDFDDASSDVCQVLMDVTTLQGMAETHLPDACLHTDNTPASHQFHPASTKTLAPMETLSIHYQDPHLLVVEKPSGLLSVPGRRYRSYDSVISRLRHQLHPCSFLQPVHRLDQGTSGLLVVARSPQAHTSLQQQFAQGQVDKTYEALLDRPVAQSSGILDLPLWGNPNDRPRQSVDYQRGKASRTSFQVLTPGPTPRVRFIPHTGRTHQIRIHAAQGLNSPLVGDRLYGSANAKGRSAARLHLHATNLQFIHPITQVPLHFTSPAQF